MRVATVRIFPASIALLTFTVLLSCTDEKIVYVERDLFEDPLPAAGEFLGYTDHDNKLVVCGNCHVEKQADWEQTAHSHAWTDLQASGEAETSCEGCHTVSELGNSATATAGYEATGEARYEDVQCEACHGPGLDHVTNPTISTVPLAFLNVGVDMTTGCGECHQGPDQPFLEEWAASRHGDGAHRPNIRTRESCMPCHSGKGALETWGDYVNYVELDDPLAEIGVTCATCHSPHSTDNEHQLRYPIDARSIESQLCMKCHHRRAIPDPESEHGPHSPQGPLLLGEIGTVGWTPPNFEYDADRIAGTHGSEGNPELCATCHMRSFTVTGEAGTPIYQATGHLFDAIPCLNAQGIPLGDEECPEGTSRTFAACTASGCHGSEDAARSAYLLAKARIADLVEELLALTDLVPESEFNPDDTRYTVGEGALFNAELGEIPSSPIHNPFLMEALLTASIEIVKETYDLPPQSSVVTRDIMRELSGGGR